MGDSQSQTLVLKPCCYSMHCFQLAHSQRVDRLIIQRQNEVLRDYLSSKSSIPLILVLVCSILNWYEATFTSEICFLPNDRLSYLRSTAKALALILYLPGRSKSRATVRDSLPITMAINVFVSPPSLFTTLSFHHPLFSPPSLFTTLFFTTLLFATLFFTTLF
jgi:hypothetical protein